MAGRDQYMNFFSMEVTSGANASTLVNENYNTGAGVSTQLAWRIHSVEYYSRGSWSGATDQHRVTCALSTRKDLSAIPELIDKGTIAVFTGVLNVYGTPANAWDNRYPIVQTFLPPMLVASPNFTIYFQANANFSGQQSAVQNIRIGFTTEKLTESAYREVFETWNYAN